jgi:hypothetical protein
MGQSPETRRGQPSPLPGSFRGKDKPSIATIATTDAKTVWPTDRLQVPYVGKRNRNRY